MSQYGSTRYSFQHYTIIADEPYILDEDINEFFAKKEGHIENVKIDHGMIRFNKNNRDYIQYTAYITYEGTHSPDNKPLFPGDSV